MADRQIVYQGQIPLETDILLTNKNAMVALGYLMEAVLGASLSVDGLACTPNTPAAMNVLVGPGSIHSLQNVDGTAYGTLAADITNQIVKQGLSTATQVFNCPAPVTTGHSIVYLIQAAYQDVDGGSVVLPYYNASNPNTPWSGPNNSGVSQNTVRRGVCLLGVKAGVSATTGTQTTPAPDAGYVGLYAVTVANGQSTITSPNIVRLATAPFIDAKLPGVLTAIQQSKPNFAQDTSGAANQINVTLEPAPTLTDGMPIRVKVANSSTGATVMSINGGANIACKTTSGADFGSNTVVANGIYGFIYDANGNRLQLQGFTAASATGLLPANNLSDVSNAATSLANLGGISQAALNAASPVAGQARNLVIQQVTSATATVSADEVITETALGGAAAKVSSLSVTLNIGGTGVNGMDTGSPLANSFLSVYAITGPGQTSGVLACRVSTSSGTIYSGANMPSGYTQSALIGVIPTDGSGQLKAFSQLDRELFYQSAVTIFTNTTNASSLTSQSISGAVPPNAKSSSGQLTCSELNGVPHDTRVAADSSGMGMQYGPWVATSSQNQITSVVLNFRQLPILTAQTLYWQTGTTGSSLSNSLVITSYTI
jgi:hypothetical protein